MQCQKSDTIKDDSLENRRSPPKPVTPAPTPELIVPTVPLGSQGLELSAQGLVCMGMSTSYGPPKADEEMIELIHKAVEHGVTLLDTSDVMGLTQMRSL
ncbi:hypothetical protein R1sor_012919 [Riccia sorocarpa]|uniref:NADP-dependent oxidoreductase domain-containing protein n=1 Tax=Riccia sorocarpa TaxID=122646 RepID=A0ABD3I5H7_9MARC